MSKFVMVILFMVVLLAGIKIGQADTKRQITKIYEDGSFYGCFQGELCND